VIHSGSNHGNRPPRSQFRALPTIILSSRLKKTQLRLPANCRETMFLVEGEANETCGWWRAALSADERRAALSGAVSRVANWPRDVCSSSPLFPEQETKAQWQRASRLCGAPRRRCLAPSSATLPFAGGCQSLFQIYSTLLVFTNVTHTSPNLTASLAILI
jgi:hypothetical protein